MPRRWPPSGGCPWSRCVTSCAGPVRSARSAGHGAGCRRCRRPAAGPGSRWPAGRSGWATTSHRRARRRSAYAAPPHRARDRRRAVRRAAVGAQQAQQHPDGGGLAAPFGPRKPVMLPGATDRSRPSSALVWPKDLDRPRISTADRSVVSTRCRDVAVIAISFLGCAERDAFFTLRDERVVHGRVGHQALGVDLERRQHHLLAVVAQHRA